MHVVQLRLSARGRESGAEIETRLQRSTAFTPDGDDVLPFSNNLPLPESATRFAEVILEARCP
jgi:ribose 1,5-bisphosphokinase PhnN